MNSDRNKDLREKILAEVKRIASENNLNTVTGTIFEKYSNISINNIYRQFDGGLTEVNELVGLKPDTSRKKKKNEALWTELLEVCIKLNRIPGRIQFSRESQFSDSPYVKRYGTWPEVLLNFNEWLKKKHSSSKFIKLLSNPSKVKKPANSQSRVTNPKYFVWEMKKSTFYGAPMNFRGLMYEPINEQGVVFLFGKISEEMGFNIEAIKPGFPDCEGKRLIDRSKNLWGQVSIEFEYESINFSQHNHNSDKCDVIICWIHNWPECPLEVIELRKIIPTLIQKNN